MAKQKAKKVKLKTHKGSKKVIHVCNSGFIKIFKGPKLHYTGKKKSAVGRRDRKSTALSKADYNRLKNQLHI